MKKNIKLKCPCCKKNYLKKSGSRYLCLSKACHHSNFKDAFIVQNNIPILVCDLLCDTVCDSSRSHSYVTRRSSKHQLLKKILVGESKVTKENCKKFVSEIKKRSTSPRILVIGSGEKGSGTELLWNDTGLEIHGIDIYGSSTVDIICDAHYLPFPDEIYDGVWIQAVLEHVVEPFKVVKEIYRVLKANGIVYAETPFMSQVHEGAYDFTRFTVLGHRYLFKQFESIDFGGFLGAKSF